MLQGSGTVESPLISLRARLMDLSIMHAEEDRQPKVVLIVDIEGLVALAFEPDDFKEFINRGQKLIEEL